MKSSDDIHVYSIDNVLRQIEGNESQLGFYEVRFYVSGSRPSRVPTEQIDTFYYYPSGGTLRDLELNIVFYEPRLDRYHAIARQSKKSADDDRETLP